MFLDREKKEKYAIRTFKGVGAASALVGLYFLAAPSPNALAYEVVQGVDKTGGKVTLTAGGKSITMNESHVNIDYGTRKLTDGNPYLYERYNEQDREKGEVEERKTLAKEESKFNGKKTDDYSLSGDVTVKYKSGDTEIKEGVTTGFEGGSSVATTKQVGSEVRGEFGRVIKDGTDVPAVSENDVKKFVESKGENLSPDQIEKEGKIYHKVDTKVTKTDVSYTKDITFNDVTSKFTTDGFHNIDGSIKYSNIKDGARVWLIEEIAENQYGKYKLVTKGSDMNDNSVTLDFKNSVESLSDFNNANVTKEGGIKDGDYVMVLERNTFAKALVREVDNVTGLEIEPYDYEPESIMEPDGFNLNNIGDVSDYSTRMKKKLIKDLGGYYFGALVDKTTASGYLKEVGKYGENILDDKGRPKANWSPFVSGRYGQNIPFGFPDYEVSSIDNLKAFYNIKETDALNVEYTFTNKELSYDGFFNEWKRFLNSRGVTTDVVDNAMGYLNKNQHEMDLLKKELTRQNELIKARKNIVYDKNDKGDGFNYDRLVFEYPVTVGYNSNGLNIGSVGQSWTSDIRVEPILYGEYTVDGVIHRAPLNVTKAFFAKRVPSGLLDTQYNDIYLVNRVYKMVKPGIEVVNEYNEEKSETTTVNGNVIVRYITESGEVIKDEVRDTENGLVSTTVTKYYLDKDGAKHVVSSNTTPSGVKYDVSKLKEDTLMKGDNEYAYVRTEGNPVGSVKEGDTVITYVYKNVIRKAPLTVHYYKEGTTEKLADDRLEKDLLVKSPYTTSAKEIPPKVVVKDYPEKIVKTTTTYELVKKPDNAEGVITKDGNVVTYYYREVVKEDVTMKQAPVIAHYYKDGTTEKLADSIEQGKKDIGSKYVTEAKMIEPKVTVEETPEKTITKTTRYELKEVPKDKDGVVPVGGKVVTYYYVEKVDVKEVLKQAPVTVHYYKDGTTEKLAESIEQGKKDIGSKYVTEAKVIGPKVTVEETPEKTITRTVRYELKEIPKDKDGVVPVGGKVVTYYYVEKVDVKEVLKQAPVTVHYYKDGTTEKLADSIEQGKKDIGSKYVTEAPRVIEEKLKDGSVRKWLLKAVPFNANGEVKAGGTTVIYYYMEFSIPKDAPVVELPEYNPPKEEPKVEIPKEQPKPMEIPKEKPVEVVKEIPKVIPVVKTAEPVVQQKVLPNTGSSTTNTAGLGLGVIAVGAVMVKQRRKLGKREM